VKWQIRHRRVNFEDETAYLANSLTKKTAEHEVAAFDRIIFHVQELYQHSRENSLLPLNVQTDARSSQDSLLLAQLYVSTTPTSCFFSGNCSG
jgi:hypothetical protein